MKMHKIEAPVGGSIWIHSTSVGVAVTKGSQLLVMECMKTEFPIESPCDGTVIMLAPPAQNVEAGDVIAMVRES
jgi:urea carboxylase